MKGVEILKDLRQDIGLEVMTFYPFKGTSESVVEARKGADKIFKRIDFAIAWYCTAIVLNTYHPR